MIVEMFCIMPVVSQGDGAICDLSLEFRFSVLSHNKIFTFPDWSEPKPGLVLSWETSLFFFRSFFLFVSWEPLKTEHFSLHLFHHPFSLTLSSLSVSHLLSCSHTPLHPHLLTLPFLSVCLKHTNVWHYDMMMAQCSRLNLSKKKENTILSRRQNRATHGQLSFVTAEKSSYSCGSLVFLTRASQSIISAL